MSAAPEKQLRWRVEFEQGYSLKISGPRNGLALLLHSPTAILSDPG